MLDASSAPMFTLTPPPLLPHLRLSLTDTGSSSGTNPSGGDSPVKPHQWVGDMGLGDQGGNAAAGRRKGRRSGCVALSLQDLGLGAAGNEVRECLGVCGYGEMVCLHAYIRERVCVCVCVKERERETNIHTRICIRARAHTHGHTCIQTYAHAHVRAY